MSRFHRLPIARIERETRDAVAITFDVPAELAEAFRFQPGQHLTLRTTINGDDVRRSYSICSAAHEGTLRIAVKRNPRGTFSCWANEALKPGDVLDVLPPMGHFNVPLDPSARRHHVGFAAGSGITPLLWMVKTTLAAEPSSEFTLFYGNRASSTGMFKEERAALHVDLLRGRIDRARADALLSHWVDLRNVDTVFVCGPDGMMQAVVDAL